MVENQNLSTAVKDACPDVELLEKQAVASLKASLSEIHTLTDARRRAKLSVSRTMGVSRELRELIKVLTQYGC